MSLGFLDQSEWDDNDVPVLGRPKLGVFAPIKQREDDAIADIIEIAACTGEIKRRGHEKRTAKTKEMLEGRIKFLESTSMNKLMKMQWLRDLRRQIGNL